jgi:hypothetical protein
MKNELNVRQLREASYRHLYTTVAGASCFCCETDVKPVGKGSAGHHLPSLFSIEQNAGQPIGDMKEYPCCGDCNSLLGTLPLYTKAEARAYVRHQRRTRGLYVPDDEVASEAAARITEAANANHSRAIGQTRTDYAIAHTVIEAAFPDGVKDKTFLFPECGEVPSFACVVVDKKLAEGAIISDIEKEILLVDSDGNVAFSARLFMQKTYGFSGAVVREFDPTEGDVVLNRKVSAVVMNPPWSENGEKKRYNVWKDFAESCKQFVSVGGVMVVVAPIRIKKWDFGGEGEISVVADGLQFGNVRMPACAVEWKNSRAVCESPSVLLAKNNAVRFDLEFEIFTGRPSFVGKKGYIEIAREGKSSIACSNRIWSKMAVSTLNYGTMILSPEGRHKFTHGALPDGQCFFVRGEKSEFDRFAKFSCTQEGMSLLIALADVYSDAMLGVPDYLLNAAFSSRHQK